MTTSFSVTASDIINASLRTLGVLGASDTANSNDQTNCLQALNIIVKDWGKDAQYLWKQVDIPVPMVVANASYQIGPTATGTGAVVTNRPLRILDAFIRDSSNNDQTLQIVSKQEYNMLGDKTSQGVPNQIYYDAQLTNGVLYVYNVPSDATHTIHLISQIAISDLATVNDTFDITQEAYRAIKWVLADELALEYGASPATIQIVAAKAAMYKTALDNWSQEETSTFFQPTPRYGRQ